MVSIYDVLKASNGIHVEDSFAEIWGRKLRGGYEIKTLTGVPPFTFTADGEPLIDWSMSGQSVQSAIPSPSSPQNVSGVGEKTGNYFDISDYSVGGTSFITKRITLEPNTTYTMSSDCPLYNVGALIAIGNVGETFTTAKNGVYPNHAITRTTDENGELVIGLRTNGSDYSPADYETMLNIGGTAQPFEPYGVKIPVNVQSGNLWNEVFPEPSENMNKYIPIYVGDGDFTFSTNAGLFNSRYAVYMFMAGRATSGGSSANNGVSVGHPRTVTAINGYVTIVYHGYSGDYYPENFWGMLNAGSTVLPHQPYSSTTTNIYLGSATSTRKIKKLMLTGGESENWSYVPSGGISRFRINLADAAAVTELKSTHYVYELANAYGNAFVNTTLTTLTICHSLTTTDAFKTFLQQQYANGTPVTVWYVLATPETAAVNEPLMKIGSYADEISKTSTGVNIPTTNGSNTLTVGTTVQPSSMSITFKGK